MDEQTELVDVDNIDTPSEKTLTQEQVNTIIRREKTAVADRVRKEMEQLHQQEIEKLKTQSSPSSQDEAALEEKIFNKMLERAQKHEEAEAEKQRQLETEQYRGHMEKVANTYYSKMALGKEKFDDFDEVMTDFDPSAFSAVAFMAADMENTPEIIYELAKNPRKLAELDRLAEKSPKLAQKEMNKLSQSIIQNQKALESNKSTNEPLSRLKPSNVGGDSGELTLRDLKKADWLRG